MDEWVRLGGWLSWARSCHGGYRLVGGGRDETREGHGAWTEAALPLPLFFQVVVDERHAGDLSAWAPRGTAGTVVATGADGSVDVAYLKAKGGGREGGERALPLGG